MPQHDWPLRYVSGVKTVQEHLRAPPIEVTLDNYMRQMRHAQAWLQQIELDALASNDPHDSWPSEKFGLTIIWER